MPTNLELSPDRAAAHALSTVRCLVVPTDDHDHFRRAREAARQIAAEHGAQVVLYDRTNETWMDHPHPRGPVTADELAAESEGDEWTELVSQLREFEAVGVTATAWLATVPSLTAMIDVMQEVAVDAVLIPAELDHPTLMERLIEGDSAAEKVERVAELQLGARSPTFFEIDDSGRIRIRHYDPTVD